MPIAPLTTNRKHIPTDLLQFRAPAAIAHATVYAFLGATMIDDSTHFDPNSMIPTWQPYAKIPTMNANEVANGVVHPTTEETITKYQKLTDESLLCEV